MLCVVRTPRTLLISRVSLMVGRQAGRLLGCGGRIVTGTNPEERECFNLSHFYHIKVTIMYSKALNHQKSYTIFLYQN